MSRIAKLPVSIPQGVEVAVHGEEVAVVGSLGALRLSLHHKVAMTQNGAQPSFAPTEASAEAMALYRHHAPTGEQHGGWREQGL